MTRMIKTMAFATVSVIAISVANGPAAAQEVPVQCRGNVTTNSIECGDGADTTGNDTSAYGDGAIASDNNATAVGSGA
ncbi:MAG: hypothetical protein NW203_05055, partial [Hyphomonadaceae bacterium]|nr:hypothetical protein [Hyphomonadaceae bacterium]